MMGPLAGTIVCDYYLIKKRKLDIRELYKGHGIYWYTFGVNWRAVTSFLLGFLPTLPGLARSIDLSRIDFKDPHHRAPLNVGDAWKLYTFAWLFGFTVAVLSYYVICTYISPPTESLVDVAVLPPGKVAVSLGVAVVIDSKHEDKKEDVVFSEKEEELPV